MKNVWITIGLFMLEMITHLLALKCPLECKCVSDFEAKCKRGSEFPRGFTSNLRILRISNIKKETLQEEAIDKNNLSMLQELHVTSCSIKYIHVNAFRGLSDLYYLDLSNNYIKYINVDTFLSNTNLSVLILNSNPLTLRRKAFLRSPSLKELSLVNCYIHEIPPSYFNELPNLERLNLSDNYLKYLSVETFKYLPNLVDLDTRRNKWICDCALDPLVSWYLAMFSESQVEVNCDIPAGKLWSRKLCVNVFDETTVSSDSSITSVNTSVTNSDSNITDEKSLTEKITSLVQFRVDIPVNDYNESVSRREGKFSTVTAITENHPKKVSRKVETSSKYYVLSNLEIMFVVFIISSSMLVVTLEVLFAINICRKTNRNRNPELIPINRVLPDLHAQPANSNQQFLSQTSDRHQLFYADGRYAGTYFESSSTETSQGYLVPRRLDDYHVYEEIK